MPFSFHPLFFALGIVNAALWELTSPCLVACFCILGREKEVKGISFTEKREKEGDETDLCGPTASIPDPWSGCRRCRLRWWDRSAQNLPSLERQQCKLILSLRFAYCWAQFRDLLYRFFYYLFFAILWIGMGWLVQ